MGDISVDLFLVTLKQLLTTSNLDFTTEEKYQLQSLEEEIKDLRGFLKFAEKKRHKHPAVMNLVVQIMDVVFDAENVVELFIVLVSKEDHASNSLREHMDHLFLDLERVRKDIKDLVAEVKQNYNEMGYIHLHLFLGTLKKFLDNDFVSYNFFLDEERFPFQALEKEIKDLRRLLKIVEKKRTKHSEVMNLVMQIKEVVSDAEKAVKLFIDEEAKKKYEYTPSGYHDVSEDEHRNKLFLDLERVKKEIKNLTFEVTQICNEISLIPISGAAVRSLEHSSTGSKGGSGSLGGSNPSEVVVGFKEDVAKLLEDLTYLSPLKNYISTIKTISIIGPGGCGKTTLAREVYDHPMISRAFEIRAWVVVSQDYDRTMRRDLLIDIFKSIFPENHEDYEKNSEDDLGEKLSNLLKGKRYLLVMDNVWNTEAWDDIKSSVPWCYGSKGKIMFTSRLHLVSDMQDVSHFVKPLSKSCSWELLEVKVFGNECCPPELVEIGKQIANKCEGLPLAIVTIAGILATNEKILSVWQQIAKQVNSIIAKDEGCMELIELSYNHLPFHLKVCFLYTGAYSEGYEISVRELTWLWIAEGFIQEHKEWRSLEEVAYCYLNDLIDRNLVTKATTSFTGKYKTCRIHGLLREICLKKAKEDNFFVQINGDDSSVPYAINKHRRLIIFRQFFDKFFFSRPYPQNLHSFLCLGSRHSRIELYMSFFVETFKLLRVFNFIADECRGEILRGQLVHLRYLAVHLSQNMDFPLPFHLFNLESLTVQTSCFKDIKLSSHIFKMVRLRHLHTKQGIFTYHVYDDEDKGNMLDSLQTLHRMCFCEHCLRFLKRTPNLKKLGLIGDPDRKEDDVLKLSNVGFLKFLETPLVKSVRILSSRLTLLPSLTQLSLKQTNLKWEHLSIFPEALPRLEVLKLLNGACSGPVWDTTELKRFSQLKYLKLDSLEIKEWKASKDYFQFQFCRLESLAIRHCKELKGIPIELGELFGLCEINVEYSNQSVEKSAKAIQEKHLDCWRHDLNLNLRFNSL